VRDEADDQRNRSETGKKGAKGYGKADPEENNRRSGSRSNGNGQPPRALFTFLDRKVVETKLG
jgi:hypothetical protein